MMNTDLGYLAVDSQIDMLENCCTGECNQGRDCPLRKQAEPASGWMILLALVPIGAIAAVALLVRWA